MTHDYEQHCTTTLFAAMNVLDGTVQRHRHQEFIHSPMSLRNMFLRERRSTP
jgi:hypothetical protein